MFKKQCRCKPKILCFPSVSEAIGLLFFILLWILGDTSDLFGSFLANQDQARTGPQTVLKNDAAEKQSELNIHP